MPTIRFFGHACFSITAGDGSTLLIDPFRSGGFNGAMSCPALPDAFDYVVTTHDHDDHAAVHTVPGARVVGSPSQAGPFAIDHAVGAHDEHGGRLRGGLTRLLTISVDGQRVVHLGDLGERPCGALLASLRQRPIDALLVPTGGYFTLGADGAAELCALLQPRFVIPCHSADDGLLLPELDSAARFLERFGQALTVDALELVSEPSASLQTVRLTRPR